MQSKTFPIFIAPPSSSPAAAAFTGFKYGAKGVNIRARVVEVFSGAVAGQDCDSFEYNFAAPDTALFEMERAPRAPAIP